MGTPPEQTSDMSFDAQLQQLVAQYRKKNFTVIVIIAVVVVVGGLGMMILLRKR